LIHLLAKHIHIGLVIRLVIRLLLLKTVVGQLDAVIRLADISYAKECVSYELNILLHQTVTTD